MRPCGRRALALVPIVTLAGVTAWVGAPRWLSVEDRLERCPVIVALNGDPPARASEAARLYHAGVGAEIWLTSDPLSSDAHGDAGTRSNTTHLIALGVPQDVIRVAPGAAQGTRAELEVVGAELARRKFACAVVVTSPVHARRVKLTWWWRVGSSPRGIVRHAPDSNYVGWRAERKELGLTVLALIGLPR